MKQKMNIVRYLLLLLLLTLSIVASAQQIRLTGVVKEQESNQPIAGVMVTIRPSGESKIVKYTQTKADGTFTLELTSFPENHVLHFSMMSFAPQSMPLEKERTIYNVQLIEQATRLKEVIVKSPGIFEKGDTIAYVVSNFADVQDKTLADVLKKMPGIEIEKSGRIKYNGVAINKFYIEGKDLLGGRYGLATNNVHQKDVSTVEVMENHQPIKALEDLSFSQNPAINIRLKEDAKARWVGTAKLGSGFDPLLWQAELFAMRFTAKAQTLNTYKTNNTGLDVSRETMAFTVDEIRSQFDKSYRMRNYISINPDRLTEIDEDRVRKNKSHIVSTNNLWSLGKNTDLTAQVSYTNNRLRSESSSQTTYFLPDSTIRTDLSESARSRQNQLSADVILTANKPRTYFKNKLNTHLLWDDVSMNVTGTYPNRQRGSIPHRQISNDLELLVRSGNKSYTVNSFNLYQHKPQELTVSRADETQYQQLRSSSFFTNTFTSLGFYFRPILLSVKAGIVGVFRQMDSELTGVGDSLGRLNNDLSMQYVNLYVSPEAEYKNGGLEAKFDMPISFTPYRYHDKLSGAKESTSKLLLSPRLYLRYYFTARFYASLSGRLAQSPVDEQLFYSGLILQNYRNLTQGLISYQTGNQKSLSLHLSYKNPMKAFFANASGYRSWSVAKRVSNRYFLNEFLLNTFIPQNHSSNLWMIDGNVSKGLSGLGGMVTLRSSFMHYKGSMFQNEVKTPYTSGAWDVSAKINAQIAQWMNGSYEVKYMKNNLQLTEKNLRTSTQNIFQTVSIHITPKEHWYIHLSGEHYYNEITEQVSKHIFLADAGFTYSFNSGWEIQLTAKNLFNQRTYSYTAFDGLTETSKAYRIRPRNFLASVFFRF